MLVTQRKVQHETIQTEYQFLPAIPTLALSGAVANSAYLMAARGTVKRVTNAKRRSKTKRNADKTDNFSDVKILSEQSLKKVWDNPSDDIWNEMQNIAESRKNISEGKSRTFRNAEEYLKSLDQD